MTTTAAALPNDFADLAAFSGWALPSERERYAKRIASTMDELQTFYDALLPRLDAAMTYLDQFPLAEAAATGWFREHLLDPGTSRS